MRLIKAERESGASIQRVNETLIKRERERVRL